MERAPWVSVSGLEFACRWDSPDLPEESLMECLVEFLNNYGIKQEVRMMKTFRSEVCFDLPHLWKPADLCMVFSFSMACDNFGVNLFIV